MIAYIVRRMTQAVLVLLLVSMLVFFAMRMLPGDPIYMYLTSDELSQTSEEAVAAVRHQFGLDRPLVVQYVDWISDAVRGDLGISMFSRRSVTGEIARVLPVTLHLGILAFLLSSILGISAGLISALRRGKWVDTGVTMLANFGITIPTFWMGILMMYLFGLQLGWLPAFGYTSPFDDFWLSTRQVIMPVFCLAIFAVASAARLTRSSMLEVTRQDYIRTAWAKGLPERAVVMRHTMKNGLIPVITLLGMHVRNIFGGSVLIETVFNIPGMGRLVVEAIFAQDYAVVQGVVLVMAVVVTLANLAVDISYGWLDPRVQFK